MQRPRSLVPRLLLGFLIALLAGCGAAGPNPPEGGDGLPGLVAHPLDVDVTLGSSAASQVVPVEGGTLELTAADGTRYVLRVPAEALVEATLITMTAIAAVDGAPVAGGGFAGVDLAPDGLRLFRPASLSITPPGGDAAVEAASFSYQAGGRQFHGYPLSADAGSLTFDILHFSGYLAYYGPGASVAGDLDAFMPADWESQFEHLAYELLASERAAHVRGEPGDPLLADKLEALLDTVYRQILEPLLPSVRSSCEAAEAHSAKLVGWARQAALFGLADAFGPETAAILDAVVAGLENCWQEVVAPCLDPDDVAQMREAIRIARQLLLLGAGGANHDPFDPELACGDACGALLDVTGWRGTYGYSFYQHAGTAKKYAVVERSAEVSFALEQRASYVRGHRIWYGAAYLGGGSSGADTIGGEWYEHSFVSTATVPSLVHVELDVRDVDDRCRYRLTVLNMQDAVHSSGSLVSSLSASFGVEAAPSSAGAVAGAVALPAYFGVDTPFQDDHFTFNGSYSINLDEVTGGVLDDAQVSWSFTPTGP